MNELGIRWICSDKTRNRSSLKTIYGMNTTEFIQFIARMTAIKLELDV